MLLKCKFILAIEIGMELTYNEWSFTIYWPFFLVCVHECPVISVVSNSFATPWTVVCQAPLSMGFSRQEYWSRLPFPPPEDLPDPEIEPHVSGSRILYQRVTWEAFSMHSTLFFKTLFVLGYSRLTIL